MKKQIKKWLTLTLAFMLILGSINYSQLTASATVESNGTVTDGNADDGTTTDDAEENVSDDIDTVSGDSASVLGKVQMLSMARLMVTATPGTYVFTADKAGFKEIPDGTAGSGYNYTATTDSNGKIAITYKKNTGWPEARFEFPEGIELKSLESIKVNVASGDASKLALKILDNNSNPLAVYYDVSNTITLSKYVTGLEGKSRIAITYNDNVGDTDVVVEIDSIELTFYNEKYCNKVYTVGEHTLNNSATYGVVYDKDTNTLSYSQQNDEAKFDLPGYVKKNITYLRNIHFEAGSISPSGAQVSYKLYKDDLTDYRNAVVKEYTSGSSADLAVGTDTVANTLVGIGIGNNYAGEMSVKVTNVVYTFVDNGNLLPETDPVVTNITPAGDGVDDISLPATATNMDKYYFNDSVVSSGPDDLGRWSLTMPANYQQAIFKLTNAVDLSKCTKVTFALSSQEGSVAFRMYTEADKDKWKTPVMSQWVQSGKKEYTFDLSTVKDTVKYISISSNKDDAATCTFDGVMFEMEEASGETYTITVYPSVFTSDKVWTNATSAGLTEDNRFNVVFGALEKEASMTLPVNINMANCESITFNVKDQVGPVNFNVWLEGNKKGNYYYNTGKTAYVLTSANMNKPVYTGAIDAVGVQAGGESATDGAAVTLESVVFTMKKTADETDRTYGEKPTDLTPDGPESNITPAGDGKDDISLPATAANMSNYYNNTSVVAVGPDDLGRWSLTMPANYQQSIFELAEAVDLSKCTKVTFALSSQEGSVAFRMYTEADKDSWSNPVMAQWGKSGLKEYTFDVSTLEDTVKYISISSNSDAATCTFDGVMFTVDTSSGSDEPIEGTENITPAGDGKDDVAYQAGTLAAATGTSATYKLTDTNQYKVEFAGQYSELKLNLTTPISLLQCTGVTFAVSEQSSPLAFKLYTKDGVVVPKYNNKDKTLYEFPISRTEEVVAIGVMMNENGLVDQTCVFDGVTFTMDTTLSTETYLVEYPAAQLTSGKLQNAAVSESDGEYVINFSAVNSEAWFDLPETVNMSQCISVIFEVSGQTDPINFHVGTENAKLKSYWYNNGADTYTLEALCDKKINQVCLQLGDNKEVGQVTLKKVSFLMRESNGEEPEPEPEPEPTVPGTTNITPAGDGVDDIAYQAGKLTVSVASTATGTLTDTNQFQVAFDKQYSELKLNLTNPINLLQCTGVTFAVSEQSSPLAFKLYTKDGTVVAKYDNEGKTLYDFALSRTGEVVAVGVMMNEKDLVDQTCVFDGVTFTMDTTLSTNTYLVEYPAAKLTSGKLQSAAVSESNGQYVIDFSAVNSEAWFDLPETVNMSQCISVIFEVSGQTAPINFHVGMENTKLKSYWYNTGADTYTLEALCKNKINQVCLQLGDNKEAGQVILKKVSFLMRESNGDEPEPEPEPEPTVPGTPNITPEGEFSYQAGKLDVSLATSATYTLTETNQYQVNFAKQYNEIKLTLPEAIDLLQCKAVTFAISSQSAPLAFKMYNEQNDEIFVKYDQTGSQLYTFDVSSTEKVKYVAVMVNQNLTDVSCVFDGVMFDVDTSATTETYTITYLANELIFDSSNAASCELQNGNYLIKFSDMDQNVNFKLPASVNLEKCVNIIFTVASQNGPVNFNVSLDKTKLKDYWYNTGKTVYILEPGITSKINEVGIQCGRENDAFVPGSFIELISVSFLMKGTEPKPAPADNNFTMDYFDVVSKSEGVTQTVDENGKATIKFTGAGDSIIFEIPDSVDVNHLVSIDFNMFAELYNPADMLSARRTTKPELANDMAKMSSSEKELVAAANSTVPEIKVDILDANMRSIVSTLEDSVETHCNPEAKYIRLTSETPFTLLNIVSIKFNVDPEAFEAIVLNGNFSREDVSMWGAALWGSVDDVPTAITVKTSDTPIYGDLYTYGEINRRSSPYVCFAQNVTERTTHATGYIFSFWAKLSDDYIGAPAEQRTVEFSPYYIDVNGKENYNMTRTGAYKQVLEPGVWTHFYGVVGLPSGAQGFIIRIVEQGTNYGKGQCVLGSYAVTGVSLTPTDYPPEPSWGKGGGGGSRSNVVTKEATCEVTNTTSDLAIDWASATTSVESDKLKISFTNNYDEVRLKLSRTLDMSTCAYIKVNIPNQNVPIAIKLYRKGKQVDVAYYNDISTSYLMVPVYDGLIDAIGIMSLATPNPAGAYALFDSIIFGLTQEPAPIEVSNDIVINGDFADEDLSDWYEALWGEGVTITQHTSSKPIYGDTYTYATYSRRTSPYQCFAQDITGRVEQNETYTFSFWAKLSDDYKGAPEQQRIVQFAPYTVDKSGKADYNPRLEGTYFHIMEPGVWYYFEGTYKVTNDNPISKVVIRILEQGTEYGKGDCVMGSYSVAGVHMEKYIPEPPSIDEDVPDLKDALGETFGDDFITGTAVTINEIDDIGVEMLVNKHFNAVTIGNELKPDALFNYSNDTHTPLQTITFNGESLEVPTLYFGRAEEILDKLLEWNESHPEEAIKVRGHVLVWHSQTPEWFFREGYTVGKNADGSENYVTPEVMNLRLEWYIKTVLEHFTGEDSPYKDMFYGWDVVNEAVSNGGNGYRTDKVSAVEPLSQSTHSSNSSWWAVYQSNEFIINAFRFANQYAPADVELYYNDYNECDNKKVVGIVKLLKDVKEAEGTRIDGMGMQGHYNMLNPNVKDIEKAIRAYAEVVGQVQFTELDMKVMGDISNDAAREKEYLAQAERYHDIYMVLKKLDAEEGIEIGGITVWGTVDKYSWLQSSSDVGGGADGTLTQCPLLFDSDYKVKPSYWAFVDYTMVDPDWTEETEETTEEKTEETVEETTEEKTPESEPEAEPVSEPLPAVEPDKSSPLVPIIIVVCAVVIGAGIGVGTYFIRRKSKAGKKPTE